MTDAPSASESEKAPPATGVRTAEGSAYPGSVARLVDELAKMPGIGRRSAERIAFHLLKSSKEDAQALSRAIDEMKLHVRHCSICFNLADVSPCPLCQDDRRDASTILVVEQPKDLIALEQTGMFRGVYHVLMGCINPLEGIGPDDLTAPDLLARIRAAKTNARGVAVEEVILGLNPTLEGDGTALYLADAIRAEAKDAVRVSRLARGLPTGGQLEHANKAVLTDALTGRQSLEP